MNITPVILTCPGREAALAATLESWRSMNGDAPEPLIMLDTLQCERRQDRQAQNSFKAVCLALVQSYPDFILFMEDDIVFNRHLLENLRSWAPMVDAVRAGRAGGGYFFGSLYNPNVRGEIARPDYFVADPEAVYGSQCFVFSESMARYFVEHWEEVEGMQDIKMSRLAARKASLYYHRPSLVQHMGEASTWGGHFHQCRDFDAKFRRGVATSGSRMTKQEVHANSYFSPALAMELERFFSKDVPVLDLGCGNGCYVDYLRGAGYDVQGIDGCPVADHILAHDLGTPLELEIMPSAGEENLRYANILCIEVGEHIPIEQADVFMDNVAKYAARTVVLSWAIPGQGGCGHVNEQPNSYVIEKMKARGFDLDMAWTARLRSIDYGTTHWLRNTVMLFNNCRPRHPASPKVELSE